MAHVAEMRNGAGVFPQGNGVAGKFHHGPSRAGMPAFATDSTQTAGIPAGINSNGSRRAEVARSSVVMSPVVAVLLLTVLVAIIGSLPMTGPWGFAAIAIIVAALVVPWTQAE